MAGDNWNYPPGADTAAAPWNREDAEPCQDCDGDCTVTCRQCGGDEWEPCACNPRSLSIHATVTCDRPGCDHGWVVCSAGCESGTVPCTHCDDGDGPTGLEPTRAELRRRREIERADVERDRAKDDRAEARGR